MNERNYKLNHYYGLFEYMIRSQIKLYNLYFFFLVSRVRLKLFYNLKNRYLISIRYFIQKIS
jgi:hypothetical protein